MQATAFPLSLSRPSVLMSFNSHKRKLLYDSAPLEHRASHARSCANHVANALGLDRQQVFDLVVQWTGVDLDRPGGTPQLLSALAALEAMRNGTTNTSRLTREGSAETQGLEH